MGRGLSTQQKQILRVINSMDGQEYYSRSGVLAHLKSTLYPRLWYYPPSHWRTVRRYGLDQKKKNAARVSIRKSIDRLHKRGLIEFRPASSYWWQRTIHLTPTGKLTANELGELDHVTQ